MAGIVLLAFNLRPAATSVGPVLAEVRADLGLGAAGAGLLTSLPLVSFAVFGILAPVGARLLGAHRLTLLSLLAVVVGLVGRATTHSALVFLALTVVSLAGMATSNVLMPSLVKLHFPDRVGRYTSLYTTALAVGLTSASVLTVPAAEAGGSWRWGLGVWALTAAVAAVPWVALVRHDQALDPGRRTVGLGQVARTRIGRAMIVTFGLQSLQAYTVFGWLAQVYRDAGFTAGQAGLLLGVVTGVSIPISLWVPRAAGRRQDQVALMLGLTACYPIGYVGLVLAPHAGALAWAVLVGVGSGVFPLVLTLIGLRTRTPDGTAALSGVSQGLGYALAAVGPLGASLLYDATGGWTVPLLTLTVVALATAAVGTVASRAGYLEDELEAGRPPART